MFEIPAINSICGGHRCSSCTTRFFMFCFCFFFSLAGAACRPVYLRAQPTVNSRSTSGLVYDKKKERQRKNIFMRRTITTPATCTRSQWTYYELWTGETMLFYPFCFQYCSLRHSFYIFFNSLNSILNGPLPGARETRKCFVTKSEISMDTWARGFAYAMRAHRERQTGGHIYY